jgi:hypothetical protein
VGLAKEDSRAKTEVHEAQVEGATTWMGSLQFTAIYEFILLGRDIFMYC